MNKPCNKFYIHNLIVFAFISAFILSCEKQELVDLTPPGEVNNLNAVAENQSVILSWMEPSDSDTKNFLLNYSPDGPITDIVIEKTKNLYTIENLNYNTEYTFTIRVEDENGNISAGRSIMVTLTSPEVILLAEDFEENCPIGMTPEGWQKFSEMATNRDWFCVELPDGISMTVNGFGGDEPAKDWLISPSFDIPEGIELFLDFDYSANFSDIEGYGLKVMISSDYEGTGNPGLSTWTELNAQINHALESENQIAADPISLKEFTGEVHLAFYYTSSGTNEGESVRVSIDNIKVATEGSMDQFAPGNVLDLDAEIGNGEVTLNWIAPNDADLKGYIIEYEPAGSTIRVSGASSTSQNISGLENGTTYEFTVVSEDMNGYLSNGTSISATPKNLDATLINESFDDNCPEAGASPSEWQTFSVSSNHHWICSDRNGEYSMEASGFGADEASRDWLISPQIELSLNNNSTLDFLYSQRYIDAEGYGLSVHISSDYNGSQNPDDASWIKLNANIMSTETDIPIPSDIISLSDFSGTVNIGFLYTSSGTVTNESVRVTLDDVIISN